MAGDTGELRLHWTESGEPPVEAAARRGFGSRLAERGLRHDLGGDVSLEFAREGVERAINAPLAGARSV